MPLSMLNVVLSASAAVLEKACTASKRAPGAVPSSRWCAAIAPAMPVPCACGFSGAPTASKRCATAPSRSGWVTSISESITAIGTLRTADYAVDVGHLELLEDVLRGVSLRSCRPRVAGAGLLACCCKA